MQLGAAQTQLTGARENLLAKEEELRQVQNRTIAE
jgi:hypothetical protein